LGSPIADWLPAESCRAETPTLIRGRAAKSATRTAAAACRTRLGHLQAVVCGDGPFHQRGKLRVVEAVPLQLVSLPFSQMSGARCGGALASSAYAPGMGRDGGV
jgi:hypothetical protein